MWWLGLLACGKRDWRVTVLAIGAGLSLGNHLTIVLLFPALLGVVYLEFRRGAQPLFILGQAGLIGLGALVYLYFPLSARHYPPVNWGNPQTIEGFLWTVTGQPYRGLLFQTPAQDLIGRISAWAQLILDQFGLPGWFGSCWRSSRIARPLRWLLVWIFAGFTAFAVGYSTAGRCCICGYLAAPYGWGRAGRRFHGAGVVTAWHLAGSRDGHSCCVCLPMPRNWTARTEAADYRAYLQDAPQGLSSPLPTRTPSRYGTGITRWVRAGRVVVVLPLTQFDWYRETLTHTYPDVAWPPLEPVESDHWGEAAVRLNPARPVCRSQVEQTGMQVLPKVTYACQ
jgi:hypothetical protein